jgi:uncharacterized protein YjbI with pentapeptide repeats
MGLRGADLIRANLVGADLTGANLTGADLGNATVDGNTRPTWRDWRQAGAEVVAP